MKKQRLRKYAHLIATVGANVKKGQEVFINCELDQPEFVKMVAEECYKAGAKRVYVDFGYQPLTKVNVKYCTDKTLAEMEKWVIDKWEHQAEVLPCKIFIMSEDPDGLKGINQKKYAKMAAARSKAIKPIRMRMENRYQWCIAAVPSKAWAKKVFPSLSQGKAVEALWEAILHTSRVWDDPVEEWNKHNKNLADKCAWLNSLKIKELHYTASNGTDLKVGLIPEAEFMAGGEYTVGSHNFFNPNIPTEEVFTSPMKGEAEGIVYSTKPLSYGGQLIENFYIRFKDGKAVECGAEKNEAMLKELIGMDEGAAYLGECALVPYSSPINQTGLLFYNTLFDENAVCHLALGRGFSNVLPDCESLTNEECKEKGINDSIVHEDFMIGTPDLKIVATTLDGKEVVIFENGEWAK